MCGWSPGETCFATACTCRWLTWTKLDALSQALPSFGHNHRALTTINSRDHLGDPALSIKANVLSYLGDHGVNLDGGRVMLLTNARVLGMSSTPCRSTTATTATGPRVRRRRGAQHLP